MVNKIKSCFIIESVDDRKKTANAVNIAKSLGIKEIIPFHIDNITKERLVQNGDIAAPFANLESNDLNNLVKNKDRTISFDEIKRYINNMTAWNMITSKNTGENNENFLIMDNNIVLKEEFKESFESEIKQVMTNLPKLFIFISLMDSSNVRNILRKCNENFNYPDTPEKTSLCYIINRLGIKKVLDRAQLKPIRSDFSLILNETGLMTKEIFVMKYPLFEEGLAQDVQNGLDKQSGGDKQSGLDKQSGGDKQSGLEKQSAETWFPKTPSLPVKQVNEYFKKVYIINTNKTQNNFLVLVSFFTARNGFSSYVMDTKEKVWDKIANASSEEGVLVIDNTIKFNMKEFANTLNSLNNEVPELYKFIGLTIEGTQSKIKHPFQFSKQLDFVHPEMNKFTSYLLTRKGAKLLLSSSKNELDNMSLLLSREHNCFAIKN